MAEGARGIMHKPLILVVEDEPKIAQLLVDYLQKDEFPYHTINEGTSVVQWVKSNQPGLVILDLMLPGKDGLTICKEIRQFSEVPIIILTARVDEIDRLLGLELGADDYVCKPFSPREVIARIRTVLRRTERKTVNIEAHKLSFAGLILDEEHFSCSLQGNSFVLTPVEFRILWAFVEKPGRVLSREQLMRRSYSDQRVVSDRTIDSHVKNLRRKIAEAGTSEGSNDFNQGTSQGTNQEDNLVHSVYGIGYKVE